MSLSILDKIDLVGHRGEPDSFPENSLEGFSYAIKSGATYIETDINITADKIVVLSHDENLYKLTGQDISITKSTYDAFKDISAGYPKRFSNRYDFCRIATLKAFVELIKQWPEVTCFIEIKRKSLACFGEESIDLVMQALQNIQKQSVLISFDYNAMVYAKTNYKIPVGWVLPEWSDENKLKAEQLLPEYLFVDIDILPDSKDDIWQGKWQWVIYTVNSIADIKKYSAMGIRLIETNCYGELVNGKT